MSTDMEKILFDKMESIENKLDDLLKENGAQNERIKAVEIQSQSTQNELTEYKRDMNKEFDKRGNSIFQVIGAIASGMTVIGLIITWILLMAKGIV